MPQRPVSSPQMATRPVNRGDMITAAGETALRSLVQRLARVNDARGAERVLLEITGEDATLGAPFWDWAEVQFEPVGPSYEVDNRVDGRTSASQGPAWSANGFVGQVAEAVRMTARNGDPLWVVPTGGAPIVRGRITVVHGALGDTADSVTYDAESEDGAITVTSGAPRYRAYPGVVNVVPAAVDSVCFIDPSGDEPEIVLTTETFAAEDCGTLLFTFSDGAGNGLDEDVIVIGADGTPVVADDDTLVLAGWATNSQIAAYDRIVLSATGEIVFDDDGSPVVADRGDTLVSENAFDFIVMGDDTTVVVNEAEDETVISPLETPGVAIEAEPTSVRSLIAQSASAGSPSAVYLEAGGGVALAANWDAGNFEIRSATFESDVATGTAPLTIASTTLVSNLNADLLDGYEASAFGLATVATAFPTSGLVSGRSTCYRTDLCEWFTYLSASDSPTGAAIWIGETFAVGFGTTAVTSSAGSQAFINEGNVLSDLVDRGKAFSFDCLVTSVEANNGDATAVSGTLTIYKNSSSLTTQTWTSNVQKGSTPLVKLTAGEVLGCDFNLSSGTLARMTVTLRLARIIAA